MANAIEILARSGLKRTRGLAQYFRRQVFAGVDLTGKRVLDLGGGNGMASFWCVTEGRARRATVLDPLEDGSNPRMEAQFEAMAGQLEDRSVVQRVRGTIEDLDPDTSRFDIVLLHNAVNHVDEEGTAALPESAAARATFSRFFSRVASHLEPGGTLILADCSNRNLFGDLGLTNPLAPTIEWRIHQPPEVWTDLLREHGFELRRVTWTARREFGRLGFLLLSHRATAYLTTSHFAAEYRGPG